MHFHPTQMLIVCLAGIGTSLAPGAPGAFALVTSTLAVQLIVFLWITCLSPSIDRIENAIEDATIVVANVKTSSITLKAIVVVDLSREATISSSSFAREYYIL